MNWLLIIIGALVVYFIFFRKTSAKSGLGVLGHIGQNLLSFIVGAALSFIIFLKFIFPIWFANVAEATGLGSIAFIVPLLVVGGIISVIGGLITIFIIRRFWK